MKLVVLGAGAVGGFVGARLARAGTDVFLLARGPHLQAIRSNGLRVESSHESFAVRVKASDDPSDAGPADALLVCVKAYQTESAAAPCRRMLDPDSVVVSLQNGLGNVDRLSNVFPPRQVVGGVVFLAAEVAAPGVIRHSGGGRFLIGPSPRSAELQAIFEGAGLPCQIEENIEQAIWEKVAGNAVFNVVPAVERCDLGDLLEEPRRELCERAFDEVAAVAATQGIVIRPAARERAWAFCRDFPRFKTSTQQDVLRRRPTEVEALLGEIVRRARRAELPTPEIDRLYEKLKAVSPEMR